MYFFFFYLKHTFKTFLILCTSNCYIDGQYLDNYQVIQENYTYTFYVCVKTSLQKVSTTFIQMLQSTYLKNMALKFLLTVYLYKWSAWILAAISDSHLSPLFRSFSLLYSNSSWVSVENSKLGPSTIASTGHASWQKPQ